MHQFSSITGPIAARKSLGYFPAVDGLRAIAVVTVILFHLNNAFLPGGFVGVDVFFVISGFVVTASLAHLHFTTFRQLLAYFYARRLTRIMPAVCTMLLVTIALYAIFIPQSWLSNLTQRSAIAAFLGFSNMVLAGNNDGYFAATTDFNPFVHTWSLGVEEQFYLIFPFLLYFHGKARASARSETLSLVLTAMLGVASFVLCGVLAQIDLKYSFYLMPSRFWELGLGMVLALTLERWQPRLASMGQGVFTGVWLCGGLMLTGALALLDESRFPFPTAIIPVAATAMAIMAACARPDHPAARALATRAVLWIGLRSYSLYLWHWPIFALMRWTCGLDTLELQIVALLLTFVIGHLSYTFVEQPLRHARALRGAARWKVALVGLAGATIATGAGAMILKLQPRLSVSRTADTGQWYTNADTPLLPGPVGCTLDASNHPLADGKVTTWTRKGCAPAATTGRLFVIGNSHALSYTPLLRQFSLDTGHETRLYFKSECAFLQLNEPMASIKRCRAFHDEATAQFMAQLRPGDVLFMPSMRLDQGHDQWGRKTPVFTDARRTTLAMTEAREVLGRLERTGARLVFEAPKPIMPSPLYRCVDWYTAGNPICAGGTSVGREQMELRREPVLHLMQDLARTNPQVEIWDPLPRLCTDRMCPGFDAGEPIYFDMHHISAHGDAMLRGTFDRDFQQWFVQRPAA